MDLPDAAFNAPLILRALCYMGGMTLFLCVLVWLGRLAFGYGNALSLRATTGLWMMRIVAGLALASLLSMIFDQSMQEGPARILPELAILILACTYYKLTLPKRDLLREPLKIAGVIIFCLVAWAASIGLGWLLFRIMPATPAVFIIGLLWNGSLLALYFYAVRKGRSGDVKLHHVLGPVMLAYMLLLMPDYIEHVGNSSKIRALLHPSPPVIRV